MLLFAERNDAVPQSDGHQVSAQNLAIPEALVEQARYKQTHSRRGHTMRKPRQSVNCPYLAAGG